jgi:hypothetical protein
MAFRSVNGGFSIGITASRHSQHLMAAQLAYPLVMTNSSPWFLDGPNRNSWFTVLKNGRIFHGYVSHNQMVNGT